MASYVLTDTAIEVLKNFANINTKVVFKAGQAQRTCNESRNFIADVELSDPLPVDCALFELNRLLGIIDTCKGTAFPTIAFGERELVVEHDDGTVTIPYAHPDVIAKPPTSQYHLVTPVASFDLPLSLWTKIKRTAAVLGTTTINIIVTKKGDLTLKLVNEKDKGGDSSGSASYRMPNTNVVGPVDNVWGVKFDALEFLPGDYTVVMGEVGVSGNAATLFGVFFKLNDPVKKVTYLTSGHVVKTR